MLISSGNKSNQNLELSHITVPLSCMLNMDNSIIIIIIIIIILLILILILILIIILILMFIIFHRHFPKAAAIP